MSAVAGLSRRQIVAKLAEAVHNGGTPHPLPSEQLH
jgi:hypothetical protein